MHIDDLREGGRQGKSTPPTEGGEYPDNCKNPPPIAEKSAKILIKNSNLSISDLKKIGLSGKWIEIAERIGVENWIKVWEILDRENIDVNPESRHRQRLWVPSYSKLIKHLRNEFIRRQLDAGHSIESIYKKLKRMKLETNSKSVIYQVRRNEK